MLRKYYPMNNLTTKTVVFIVFIIVLIAVVDTIIASLYDLTSKNIFSSQIRKIVFTSLFAACIFLQLMLLQHARSQVNSRSRNVRKLTASNKIGLISYLFIVFVASILIFQLFYYNYYHTLLLSLIVLASYGTATYFTLRTSMLFISWYKRRHNFVILMYIISMTLILSNLVITNVVVNSYLTEAPVKSREYMGGTMDLTAGKYGSLDNMLKISSILSFLSMWLTTIILSSTKGKIEKFRYLIMPTILLVYFLASWFFQDIFTPLFSEHLESDPVLFSAILGAVFILTNPIGGVMFGIAFWINSKRIAYESSLKKYLLITGYGFLFLFAGNQSSFLVSAPYPPFGITFLTVLIMGSYFIMIGIYSSAKLTSTNNELRSYVHSIAKESKLLNRISVAEMEKEVDSTVGRIIKEFSVSTTEVSSDMEFNKLELKDYVTEVIEELKKNKK
jgi:hypothetical protein